MNVHVFCESMTDKDRKVLVKVLQSVDITDCQITSFSPGGRLRLDAPINIVCSDGHPSTEGEELLYLWPKPSTFMSSQDMKREVWMELSGSVGPMAKAVGRKDDVRRAGIGTLSLKEIADWPGFAGGLEGWKRDDVHLEITDRHGDVIHVFAKEKPGENERELTVDELLIIVGALAAFEESVVTVSRKGDCLQPSGNLSDATL